MKNCTKHSVERWVERIVKITTKKEKDDYIRDNNEQIKEHMNKTFDFSEFIFKGQIGDNTTKNYYIKDDLIFVLNTQDDAIVTVYTIDFNFTEELNLQVAKGLLEKIKGLLEEKEKIEYKVLEELEFKESVKEQVLSQINILSEQLNALKRDRDFIDNEIKHIKSKNTQVGLEIKKYTNMLVNSKEYREDLKIIG